MPKHEYLHRHQISSLANYNRIVPLICINDQLDAMVSEAQRATLQKISADVKIRSADRYLTAILAILLTETSLTEETPEDGANTTLTSALDAALGEYALQPITQLRTHESEYEYTGNGATTLVIRTTSLRGVYTPPKNMKKFFKSLEQTAETSDIVKAWLVAVILTDDPTSNSVSTVAGVNLSYTDQNFRYSPNWLE